MLVVISVIRRATFSTSFFRDPLYSTATTVDSILFVVVGLRLVVLEWFGFVPGKVRCEWQYHFRVCSALIYGLFGEQGAINRFIANVMRYIFTIGIRGSYGVGY